MRKVKTLQEDLIFLIGQIYNYCWMLLTHEDCVWSWLVRLKPHARNSYLYVFGEEAVVYFNNAILLNMRKGVENCRAAVFLYSRALLSNISERVLLRFLVANVYGLSVELKKILEGFICYLSFHPIEIAFIRIKTNFKNAIFSFYSHIPNQSSLKYTVGSIIEFSSFGISKIDALKIILA